jgi:hypothetical protein
MDQANQFFYADQTKQLKDDTAIVANNLKAQNFAMGTFLAVLVIIGIVAILSPNDK